MDQPFWKVFMFLLELLFCLKWWSDGLMVFIIGGLMVWWFHQWWSDGFIGCRIRQITFKYTISWINSERKNLINPPMFFFWSLSTFSMIKVFVFDSSSFTFSQINIIYTQVAEGTGFRKHAVSRCWFKRVNSTWNIFVPHREILMALQSWHQSCSNNSNSSSCT